MHVHACTSLRERRNEVIRYFSFFVNLFTWRNYDYILFDDRLGRSIKDVKIIKFHVSLCRSERVWACQNSEFTVVCACKRASVHVYCIDVCIVCMCIIYLFVHYSDICLYLCIHSTQCDYIFRYPWVFYQCISFKANGSVWVCGENQMELFLLHWIIINSSEWIINALSIIVCSEMLKLSRNNLNIKMFGWSPRTLYHW